MVRAREASTVRYIRFLTPLLALSLFFIPSIWLTTTLPPVAKAEKRAMRKFWIVLKQLTPLTAASPAWATIMVSATPTVTVRRVSMRIGMYMFPRSLLEKSLSFFSVMARSCNRKRVWSIWQRNTTFVLFHQI